MDKKQIKSIAIAAGIVFLQAGLLGIIFKIFGNNTQAIIEVIAEIF
jgi:hypothetical protein